MKIGQLMESRIQAMVADRNRLLTAWSTILESAEDYLKQNNKPGLTTLQKMNIARICESALLEATKGRNRLFEATDSSAIQFLGIQLPVIAALLPSLVLNEIATVQALERRVGGIFYLNVKYGQAKGSISANSTMMDAKTGHNATVGGRRYASQRVDETVEAAYASGAQSGSLTYVPVVAGSVVITNGTETWTDNGSNVLVSDVSTTSNGTIDYDTGAYTFTIDGSSVSATACTANYKYNYETKTSNNVPTVNFEITEDTLTAEDFPLNATYSLTSAIDLERAHGLSFEDEMVKYLSGEVKFAQDHLGIDLIVDACQGPNAADAVGTYSVTPSTGETWIWKKFQFLDQVEKANNNIIAKTLRMQATYLIVGNNGARLIKQLEPHFKLASDVVGKSVTGPYVLGTLDGRTVIHDPFISANFVGFGFKGNNWTEAAFAYAPYIPLITTPTVALANLQAQKGFLASSAYKVINPGAFTYMTLSGY